MKLSKAVPIIQRYFPNRTITKDDAGQIIGLLQAGEGLTKNHKRLACELGVDVELTAEESREFFPERYAIQKKHVEEDRAPKQGFVPRPGYRPGPNSHHQRNHPVGPKKFSQGGQRQFVKS